MSFIVNPYRFAVSGGSDPYWANVSALLHMQGADNGTTFTDSSSNALTVTALGTAKTTTATFKWGNSCMTGSRLSIAANAVMGFGTGNYTVEMWVKWISVSGSQALIDFGNCTTYLRFDGGNKLYLIDGGAYVINAASISTLSAGQWYHVALVRNGNARNVYIDGVSVASATSSLSSGSSSAPTSVASWYDTNLPFNGYMQDLRVTKGVARYTATFTPPSAQFPDS